MFLHSVAWLSLFLTFSPPIAKDIERGFLRNSAKDLYSLFPTTTAVNISLPDPFSFSDELSNEQAYFLIHGIFSFYRTIEFTWESGAAWIPGRPGGILKARWSFRNARNNIPSLYSLFFFISRETDSLGVSGREIVWKILEIKAERL